VASALHILWDILRLFGCSWSPNLVQANGFGARGRGRL